MEAIAIHTVQYLKVPALYASVNFPASVQYLRLRHFASAINKHYPWVNSNICFFLLDDSYLKITWSLLRDQTNDGPHECSRALKRAPFRATDVLVG